MNFIRSSIRVPHSSRPHRDEWVCFNFRIPNGNLLSYAGSVWGSWSFGYDNLNRLTSGSAAVATNLGQYFCWSYDSFGNRTAQTSSTAPFQSLSPCETTGATTNTCANCKPRTRSPAQQF